jgi:endonuclease YncB( thermonuclease family)
MTDEADKTGKPKKWAAWVFGLLLVGCSAILPPPTNSAVLIALASPTPTLISEYEPTWQPQTIIGKVVGVSDGDTITVLDADKRQHKIRLDGIDAPKSHQDFGSRAKQSLSDLVFGKTVTVTRRKYDRYGRMLGTVTLDGKDINQEQINRGMAWFNWPYETEYPANVHEVYRLTETLAREKKRGLWADASPVPPWDYRRSGRPVKAPYWETPTTATGPIVGNRNSKIYHLPNCPDYSKVGERNRVPFVTEAEAQAAGYRKAKNCPQ